MMIGARIIALEGFQCLAKGVVYHFLHSDSDSNRVKLVHFNYASADITADLLMLPQNIFEEALENKALVEDGRDDYPPWLKNIQGYSISFLEDRRSSTKENYNQKVDRRFMAISELVGKYREILSSDNPGAIINRHAKSQRPQQNAIRLRLWFYSYIVFGFNKWALMPLLHRIGGWNREENSSAKHGRPHRKGQRYGYNCSPVMKEKILNGLLAYKDTAGTKAKLYSDILVKKFGCEIKVVKGVKTFVQPNGEPFPSFGQMKYWAKKMIGPKNLALELNGKHKTRSQSGSAGSFAERLSNLCQRVEFDGYYISEKMSGITEGSAVDGFCVVRAVCGLSGAVVDIGFAEGRETMEAYKMALFSMALDKVKFCELFGLNVSSEEWPCYGLAGGVIFDRGSGATYGSEPEINWLGSIELTPTFSGQSKATVESSHPRDKKSLEQPTYFHSKLNFVLMARREILQVLADNQSSDASGRITEEMIINRVKPTPHGIWNFLDSRGRNSSIAMPFDEAVRTFLTEHPVTIRKDAVYFYGRKYRSAALIDTHVFDRVARSGSIKTTVFAITMCVRHIWIELDGLLYELDFMSTAATPEGTVDISLSVLKEIDKIRREAATDHRDEIPAIQQEYRDRFKKDTGVESDSGQRKKGRPTKDGAARRDIDDFNRFRGKAK